MSAERFSMNYEITTQEGAILKPTAMKLAMGKPPSTESLSLDSIAHYLVGLSYTKLGALNKQTSAVHTPQAPFANLAWKSLDPHFELYWKTQAHLRNLMDQASSVSADRVEELEKSLDTVLEKTINPWGLDFKELGLFLEKIDGFEQRTKAPLLYNFGLKFSTQFIEKLHALYSLLFHVRCLIASHHNLLTKGSVFDALRVDSLSDYLPSAEFVANDAALYLQFKKHCQPFIGHKVSDPRIEKLLVEPLQRAFENWTHNACHLVANLPPSILNELKSIGVENELYRIQMDWLLGAPAGLLFRLREELYGLAHGYDQIFWPDASESPQIPAESLNFSFSLGEHELFGHKSTVA